MANVPNDQDVLEAIRERARRHQGPGRRGRRAREHVERSRRRLARPRRGRQGARGPLRDPDRRRPPEVDRDRRRRRRARAGARAGEGGRRRVSAASRDRRHRARRRLVRSARAPTRSSTPCSAKKSGIADGIGACADFDPEAAMTPKDARRSDRYTQLAVAAATQAAEEAGVPDGVDLERLGVLVGTGVGGLITLEERVPQLLRGRRARGVPALRADDDAQRRRRRDRDAPRRARPRASA